MSFFIPTAAAGNGLSLATFGPAGELMGFFYPRIDFAQNVREGMPALRLFHGDGHTEFLWCFDPQWQSQQQFAPTSNVLTTRLTHRHLDLQVEITDVLPPGRKGLIRHFALHRGPDVPRVQLVHYFRLALGDMEWRNGVQAFADQNLVIQHFQDITLAASASRPFQTFCSTVKQIGFSPAKEAMVQGQFGQSPQAIGRVDFGIGFECVEALDWQCDLVLAGGATRELAVSNARGLLSLGIQPAVQEAGARGAAFLAQAGRCPETSLTAIFDRAVLSLLDLFDESEGTFLAAPEFDQAYELSGGYGYCWPRDAAICALICQRIGQADKARRFFEWAARTQLPDGHWFQRYWTDGSPAASWCVHDQRIQLDQTCAMVHGAGRFARGLGTGEAAFVQAFRPTAEKAVRAILGFVRDGGLHAPAIDLWEHSVGSFAYTQAAVIAALAEADEVFQLWPNETGEPVRARLRQAMIDRLWDGDRQRWLRCITPDGGRDATLDSSPIGLIEPWQVLNPRDPVDRQLAMETVQGISHDLRSPVRGGSAILRFENESYMGGGPGCVNTLWLAVCKLRLAATSAHPAEQARLIEEALADVRVAAANTNPTGQLPELIPRTTFSYWAAPHGWSSALFIEAMLLLREIQAAGHSTFDAERVRVRRIAPTR